ncbi:MAG: hypothetical protein R6U95_07735 [Bacteroidales bacterium]
MNLIHPPVMQLYKHILIFIFVSLSVSVFSQQFEWNGKYEFIADNREYFSPYGFPQTILQSRMSGEAGIRLDSNQVCMGGVSYTIKHGENHFKEMPILLAYYRYSHNALTFKAGSFPYKYTLPYVLYTDSLLYTRPNIEGMLCSFENQHIQQHFFIDWLFQQNYGEHEQFMAGTYGIAQYKNVLLRNDFYYLHEAYDIETDGKQVIDNGAVHIGIGYDFSQASSFLDTAHITIGGLHSWYRFRPDQSVISQGVLLLSDVFYNNIGLETTVYYGDKTHINLGDPLYRSGEYTRFNAVFAPRLHEQVSTSFKFCMHIVDSEINYSQQIQVTVLLN